MNTIIRLLDNIKIKKKLLIIYFVCLIFPILFTNITACQELKVRIKEDKREDLSNMLEKVAADVDNTIAEIEGFTNMLYTNMEVYEVLEREYTHVLDFIEIYTGYIRKIFIGIIPYYSQMQQIKIYTDNPTIISSGTIKVIDEEEGINEQPRLTYNADKGDIKLPNNSWISLSTQKVLSHEQPKKYLTIYRHLDKYKDISKYKKIVAIDINIEVLHRSITSENLPGNLYIVNENNQIIIQSHGNISEASYGEFLKYEDIIINSDQIVLEQPMNINGLKIVGVFDESHIYDAIKPIEKRFYMMTMGCIILTSLCIGLIANSFCRRIEAIVEHIDRLEKDEFECMNSYEESKDEIGIVIKSMNQMSRRIKELIDKKYILELNNTKAELESRQAKLNALQSQVNPHFMFNALEAIRLRSVIKGEKETAEMIKYMAKMFRKLINWSIDWITIEEELEFIREFLKIQKYRFDDELEFSINIPPELKNYRIPKMILQPLVENACVHGVEKAIGIRNIAVSVEKQGDFIHFIIADNGIGISPERINQILDNIKSGRDDGVSIGLKNIYRRINLYYGDKSKFKIESKENLYTQVKLIIPINE